MSKQETVYVLIVKWTAYRITIPEPGRYLTLAEDLYNVRNSVPGISYPPNLIDPDDEIMASVEHYFLTRSWVGNGIYPEWQVRSMVAAYNAGKVVGLAPRHNPSKPVTRPSLMQIGFQQLGILHGNNDLKASRKSAPLVRKPPKYW